VRGGPDTQVGLPPHTVIDPGDMSDFDPAGQRLALPLDTTDSHGTITGTSVYVVDLGTRTIATVPGGPVPVAALPAVLGAFPAGSPAIVSVRWSAAGPGLWIVATDGLYFQAGYWRRRPGWPTASASPAPAAQLRDGRLAAGTVRARRDVPAAPGSVLHIVRTGRSSAPSDL